MATIITTNRTIIVEETFEIVSATLHRDWIRVNEYIIDEDLEVFTHTLPIKLNTSHIIEVQL